MLELTVNALWRTRHEEMHDAAERAANAARRLGDRRLISAALAELALASSLMGAAERAESSYAEAATLVDSLSDDELAGHLEAAAWLAGVELYLDRYAEGEAHAERALTVARATGQGELFLLLAATLGGLRRQRGKLVEAAELLDGGIEAARLLGNTHALVWTLLGRSAAALRSGDVELALATAQESFDLSQHAESNFHSAEAAADLAAALLEAGQPEPAVRLLLEFAGGEELTLIAGSPRARYLEVLARCRLALDATGEARQTAGIADAWASAVQLADGSCLGRPDGGGRRAAYRRSRRAQPSGHSRRLRPPTPPARRSRPRCRARWRASRWAARAPATARRPNCNEPPEYSSVTEHSDTGTRRNASSASLATASTGARGVAGRTARASSR